MPTLFNAFTCALGNRTQREGIKLAGREIGCGCGATGRTEITGMDGSTGIQGTLEKGSDNSLPREEQSQALHTWRCSGHSPGHPAQTGHG